MSVRLFSEWVSEFIGMRISEPEIKGCILEVFNLDEKYAIPLGLDDRPVAGPYPIFKITRDKTVKIN